MIQKASTKTIVLQLELCRKTTSGMWPWEFNSVVHRAEHVDPAPGVLGRGLSIKVVVLMELSFPGESEQILGHSSIDNGRQPLLGQSKAREERVGMAVMEKEPGRKQDPSGSGSVLCYLQTM